MTDHPTDTLAQTFHDDGIVVLPDFYSPADLAAVNADLDARWQAILADHADAAYEQAYAHIRCQVVPWMQSEDESPAIAALLADTRLAAVSAAILGPGFTHLHSSIMYAWPGGSGQAWHQDCPGERHTHYNVNRLIYTRDVTRDDGPLAMVPGSHRATDLPPGGADDPLPGERIVTARAGTLVLMHGRCYHRVLPNRSDRPRISVNMRQKSPAADQHVINPIYRHMSADERRQFRAGIDANRSRS